MTLFLVANFHGIGTPGRSVPADEVPYWCPQSSWPEMADALARLAADERVTLEITFDDGNLSDLTEAMPALLRRGLTATFLVCSGRLGRPDYLSPAHLRELKAAGMEIGSHGHDHVDLRRVDDETLAVETETSKRVIEDAVGAPVTRFALPFGSYDRRVLGSLRQYETVYSSDAVRAQRGRWLVPRYSYVNGWRPDDLHRFALDDPPPGLRLRRWAVGKWKALR